MRFHRFSSVFRYTLGAGTLALFASLILATAPFTVAPPPRAVTAMFPPLVAAHRSGGLQAASRASALARTGDLKLTPTPRLVEGYGKLPLSFEINQGQTDSQVKFLSRGPGYTLFLTGEEAVLSLRSQKSVRRLTDRSQQPASRNSKLESRNSFLPESLLPRPTEYGLRAIDNRQSAINNSSNKAPTVLRMTLVGANANAKVTGLDPLPGKSNYFLGNDPKKWRTNVSNYAKVRYTDVYPGVDLVYYGNQGQLEYDFVVAPGADPNAIALEIETGNSKLETGNSKIENGQSALARIDAQGDLVIPTDAGEVRFRKPLVYQPSPESRTPNPGSFNRQSSIDNRQFLDGRYTLTAKNQVRFEVPEYDSTLPLIIDPTLAYRFWFDLGGLRGIAADAEGNLYVTGTTSSTDFPATFGAFQTACVPDTVGPNYCHDAFVLKLNSDGAALIYATFLGGSSADGARGIAADTSGNAYVAGNTSSVDFPTTPGAFQPSCAVTPETGGCADAFVTKLGPDGSALVYSTFLGGTGTDSAVGVALDASGNAYVGGYTTSSDFPTVNALQPTFPGGQDGFVTKLNAEGTALVYSTYLGGSGWDSVGSIAVDSRGNVYALAGGLRKLSADGSTVVYSASVSGSKVAVDAAGNAYVLSKYEDNSYASCWGWMTDDWPATVFDVTKMNAEGSAAIYHQVVGGTCVSSIPSDLAVDPEGNAYIVAAETQGGRCCMELPFLAKLDPTGGRTFLFCYDFDGHPCEWQQQAWSGSQWLWPGSAALAVDSSANIYSGAPSWVMKIAPYNFGVYLKPSFLRFSEQAVGTTSPAQTATIITPGPLNIASITVSGDFAETHTGYVISVTFTPTTSGLHSGTLTVTHDAGSPITATLSGYAPSAGVVGFSSPETLSFPDQTVGITSSPLPLTLTNNGAGELRISHIYIYGSQFAQTNDCPISPTPLTTGATCTIDLTFTPDHLGAHSGTLLVSHDAMTSPARLNLTGNGIEGIPTITSLSPPGVPVGSLGFTLTVNGHIFSENSKVRWNGGDLPTQPGNMNQISATVPPASLESTGTAQITVFNNTPGGGESQPATFTIYVPATYSVSPTAYNYRTIAGTLLDLRTRAPCFSNGSAPVFVKQPSPFPIHFGGGTFTDLIVGSRGTVSFADPVPSYASTEIPTAQANLFVAPWWGVMLTPGQCIPQPPDFYCYPCWLHYPVYWDVMGEAPNRELVIEWRNINLSSSYSDPRARFQVVFFESSTNILFNYADVASTNVPRGSGAQASIGVQVAPNFGTQFSYMTPSLTNEMALLWEFAPPLTISPVVLGFGNQAVGATSAPKTVTLTNTGDAPVTIASIAASGDFAQSNSCPSSLAPTANCTISVTFTPPARGTATGAITISDNTPGNPHVVRLLGIGVQPTAVLTPASLTFDNQLVGTTSAAQTITLASTGYDPLVISSLVASGPFGRTSNCGQSVDIGRSCAISVTFTPTAPGTATGAITITDDALDSPQTVPLTGTGVVPIVTLSKTTLRFVDQPLGTTSAPQAVTLTNSGSGPLTISSISTSGNYAQSHNCVSPLAAGAYCTINVTFTPPPTVAGGQARTLTIVDNAAGSPHTVALNGIGVGPVAVLSTTSLNFGNQLVGVTSTPKTVTLSDSGNAPMTITSITASGDFAQTNNCVSPLAAHTYCTLSVTFTPPVTGTRSGAITIVDDATGSPRTVSLAGNGAVPGVTLLPTSLRFVDQPLGTTSAAKPVKLTNSGLAPLTISSISTSGNYAQTNNCVSPLAAGAYCTINVTFTPLVAGGQSGTLTIVDNAAGSPHTVALNGIGVGPVAVLSTTSLNFGNQLVGTTSTPKTVTLSDSGNAPLTVTSIVADGDFAQTNNCVSPLAARTYCTFTVKFAPTAVGTRTGAITITDNALGSPHTVSLAGTGTVPAVTLSPTSLRFVNQPLGATSTPQAVTLTNTGTAPLVISSISTSGNYAQSHNCVSPLAAKAYCTINVTFTPLVAGGQSGTLTIVDNAAGSPHTVALNGIGVGPVAVLSTTSLNFGNQQVGTTSTPKTMTLSNSGNAPMTITSLTASGDFTQTNNCVSPLAARTYCTFTVKFAPTAVGTRTGALTITDNALGSPHMVNLTGIGVSL